VDATGILVILLPIALLFFLFNGQRKRQRQAAALQEQIVVGSTICLTSGLFGEVVSLTDREVVLEAAPGVNLRYDRRAIGLVVPSGEPATDEPSDDPSPPEADMSGETDGHDQPA
jgi:preprotein translocase subunit YajC